MAYTNQKPRSKLVGWFRLEMVAEKENQGAKSARRRKLTLASWQEKGTEDQESLRQLAN